MKTKEGSSHPLHLSLPSDAFRDRWVNGYVRSILDNIAIGITILGTGMEILWMNKNFRDAFPEIDLSKTPFCYKTFYSPPREKVCDYCPSIETFRTGEVHEAETDACSNGRIYRLIASPVKDEEGRVISVVETAIDITEQKEMEKRLREAKKDWEDTFDGITDMVTIHDKDFNIIRANRAAREILKLPDSEVNKVLKCFKYYHGTECPPQGCPSCECLKTGKTASFELFEPHLNKHIEIRAMPRFDERGDIIGIVHIVRDITDRKRAEEEKERLLHEIMNAKEEWETTFDTVSDLIILVDEDLRIIRCNRSFAGYVDMPFEELLGKRCTDFLPCIPEAIRPDMQVKRQEVKAGERWFYLSIHPLREEVGSLRYIIIASDITSIKETQRELKKRVDELERFYKVAIDREARMRELKKEIAKLREDIGVLRSRA